MALEPSGQFKLKQHGAHDRRRSVRHPDQVVEQDRGRSQQTDNARAIALYERVGFKREGLLRDAVLLDGRYMDMILMALINRPPDHPGGPASQ